MGQKRDDFRAIPMCLIHHDEQHQIGWPRFIQTYELDVREILRELRERPRLEIARFHHWSRPTPEIKYVAAYRDALFTLLPVGQGLKASLDCAFRVCGEYLRDRLIQRRVA
jgi:hypothetical protein